MDYREHLKTMTEAEREYWEERAAVREFEAGMTRPHAEYAAWLDIRDQRERKAKDGKRT